MTQSKLEHSRPRRVALTAIVALSCFGFAACGDDDDTVPGGTGGRSGGTGGRSGGTGGRSGGTGGAATTSGGAVTAGSGGTGGIAGKGGAANTGGVIGNGDAGNAGEAGGAAGQGGMEPSSGGASEGGEGGSGPGGSAGEGGSGGGEVALPNPCRGTPLPANQHYVAPDLCASAVATGQGKLRQLSFASNGDLLGVRVSGEIVRYRDVNEDGSFGGTGEVTVIANTGGNGNNAHLDEASGYIYAGTASGVRRWAYSASSNALGAGEDVITGAPSTGNHTFHTVHVYDGWLYAHTGSENNAVAPATPDYDNNRAVIKRFRLADFSAGTPFLWSAGEVFARGVRNMVGFGADSTGRIYGVDNGIDNLVYGGDDAHEQNPGEDIDRLQAGKAYGYPYCFSAAHILEDTTPVLAGTQLASSTDPSQPDPDFVNPHDNTWCATNSTAPVTLLPAHTAPLDITFFDRGPAGALPTAWRGGAFVALHGSWNRTASVGHSVVFVPFNGNGTAPQPVAEADGTTFTYTVVFGGGSSVAHNDGAWSWSSGSVGEDLVRPVGVAVSPVDGALYVSSDNAPVLNAEEGSGQGAIYRIGLRPE